MQLYSLDKQAFTDFHGRLKKRLTDVLKRLLGIYQMNLWIDDTTTGEVLDLEAAIQRIVYSFTNPLRARKSRTIEDYTGCNTWKEFFSVPPRTDAYVDKEVPWILLTDIEPLSCFNPSSTEEQRVISELKDKAKSRMHTLRVYPLKWLEPFGIKDPEEIEKIRGQIVSRVRELESNYTTTHFPKQKLEGYVVTDEYIPPKRERRIFMFGSTAEIRKDFMRQSDLTITKADECYQLLKLGHTSISWPPEVYIPPPPNGCNPIRCWR